MSSAKSPTGFRVDYDPRLVEEAVLRAIRDAAEEPSFRAERDRIYELQDAEEQEAVFRTVHAQWFVRLGLGRPIEQAFEERPSLTASTCRCVVVRANSRKQESADLFVAPPEEGEDEVGQRSIGIQVRSDSFLDPDFLLGLLRHEFLHIADMLDPAFGYEPELPEPEGGAMAKRLLQDRYLALWDAAIDGRLVREERAPVLVRERRLRDFARAFPMLGEQTENYFDRYFDAPFHTHSDLLAFACAPGEAESPIRDTRCPLCGFPTQAFEQDPEGLPVEVRSSIVRDFPAWVPARGLCVQCADLYRSRLLSSAAAALLPKIS